MGPVQFNIFISDIGNRIKCTLNEFSDDTKMRGVVNMPKGLDAIQGDPHRLEQWVQENIMMYNKYKYKVLYLGCGNPCYQGAGQKDGAQPCPKGCRGTCR